MSTGTDCFNRHPLSEKHGSYRSHSRWPLRSGPVIPPELPGGWCEHESDAQWFRARRSSCPISITRKKRGWPRQATLLLIPNEIKISSGCDSRVTRLTCPTSRALPAPSDNPRNYPGNLRGHSRQYARYASPFLPADRDRASPETACPRTSAAQYSAH